MTRNRLIKVVHFSSNSRYPEQSVLYRALLNSYLPIFTTLALLPNNSLQIYLRIKPVFALFTLKRPRNVASSQDRTEIK
jgi:hypothetical protein